MEREFTVDDVLKSIEKYGKENVLTWDPEDKVNDNKTKNKGKNAFDCTWIPIKFKHVSGETAKLDLKFSKIITSSAAKPPPTNGEVIKAMSITFKEINKEEIAKVIIAKQKDTPEEQDKENIKVDRIITDVVESTKQFVTALDAIDTSYKKICEDIKSAFKDPKKVKNLTYNIKKDKNTKSVDDINISSIKQSYCEDKENPNQSIEFTKPLFRVKLLVNKDSGKIGADLWDKTEKRYKFSPIVYDARKSYSAKDKTPVKATVKVDGVSKELDKTNAGEFINFRSIISGNISFPEVICSKSGFSLRNNFKKLIVKSNKIKNNNNSVFSQNEIDDLKGNSDDENESENDKCNVITDNAENLSLKDTQGSDIEDVASVQDSNLEDDCLESELDD